MLPHARATGAIRRAVCARSFGLLLGCAPSPAGQRGTAKRCAEIRPTAPAPLHRVISRILRVWAVYSAEQQACPVENTRGGQGKSGQRRLIPKGQPRAFLVR